MLSGVAAPLFFAISGALLIPKENEKIKIVLKRLIRIVLVLVIFSFFYYLITLHIEKKTFDMVVFVKTLYSNSWNGTFWFLYAYVAYLVSLPLLRKLCNVLDDKHFYYTFAIAISIRLFPLFNFCVFHDKLKPNPHLIASWLVISYILFPCLGYFLEHRVKIDDDSPKKLMVLMLLDILLLSIACYVGHEKYLITKKPNDVVFYESVTIVINCITVYLGFKYIALKNNIGPKLKTIINVIGECTFGIYLFHFFVLRQLTIMPKTKQVYQIWGALKTLGFNPLVTAYIVCTIVFLICCLVTYFCRKIPVVRKFL